MVDCMGPSYRCNLSEIDFGYETFFFTHNYNDGILCKCIAQKIK